MLTINPPKHKRWPIWVEVSTSKTSCTTITFGEAMDTVFLCHRAIAVAPAPAHKQLIWDAAAQTTGCTPIILHKLPLKRTSQCTYYSENHNYVYFCHYNSYYEIWWFIIKIYLLSLYYIILCLSSSFFSSTVHPNDAICEWPLIIKIIQTGFERKIIIIIMKFIHKRWWSHLTCIFHGFTDNWNSFRHRYPMTP